MKDFYTIENGKAVHYERTGECNKCGECCGIKNTITYNLEVRFGKAEAADPTTLVTDWKEDDWSSWEGYTLLWAQGLWWYFKVLGVSQKEDPKSCGEQDPATMLCNCWNVVDEFPAICRYWPFRQSDLDEFPNCVFKFKEVTNEQT